ncbi:MAG: NosD domain-containing protein, partial [Candidatus Methanospirareceae archaeon]
MKAIKHVCVAFVLLCAFVGVSVASAKTIYVPDDYAKIQWAVDNASAGDTIIVRSGTYYENVVVSKSLEIRSHSQNPSDTIIKASNPNDHVFNVTVDNVTIKGFTVTEA